MVKRKGTFGKIENIKSPEGSTDRLIDPPEGYSDTVLMAQGKKKLPKGAVFAKDAKTNELYVNYERTPRMVRILNKGKDKIEIMFYAENLHDWLKTEVGLNYPLGTDITRLPPGNKPPNEDAKKEKQRARAAHLPKFQRTKPIPTKVPANGKKVFKGKIGDKKFLIDIGDGSRVGEIEDGVTTYDAAAKMKRELVSQSEVGEYAMYVFTEEWKSGRKTIGGINGK